MSYKKLLLVTVSMSVNLWVYSQSSKMNIDSAAIGSIEIYQEGDNPNSELEGPKSRIEKIDLNQKKTKSEEKEMRFSEKYLPDVTIVTMLIGTLVAVLAFFGIKKWTDIKK